MEVSIISGTKMDLNVIAQINETVVKPGDWALISVQPFTSEETLTVTMKNDDQFVVRVTDAQIFSHVITAKGERFRITVTYDEEAKIPDGSQLVAREIVEGSEEYEQYLEEAAAQRGGAVCEPHIGGDQLLSPRGAG